MPLLFAVLDKKHRVSNKPWQIVEPGEYDQVVFHTYLEEPIFSGLLYLNSDKVDELELSLSDNFSIKTFSNELSVKAELMRLARVEREIKQKQAEIAIEEQALSSNLQKVSAKKIQACKQKLETEKIQLADREKRLAVDLKKVQRADISYCRRKNHAKLEAAELTLEKAQLEQEESQLKADQEVLIEKHSKSSFLEFIHKESENQTILESQFSFDEKVNLEQKRKELQQKFFNLNLVKSTEEDKNCLTMLGNELAILEGKLEKLSLEERKFFFRKRLEHFRYKQDKLKEQQGLINKILKFNFIELLYLNAEDPNLTIYILDIKDEQTIWDSYINHSSNFSTTKEIALDINELHIVGYISLADSELVFNQIEIENTESDYYQYRCMLIRGTVEDAIADIDYHSKNWLGSMAERAEFKKVKVPLSLQIKTRDFQTAKAQLSRYKKWIKELRSLRCKVHKLEITIFDYLKNALQDTLFSFIGFFIIMPAATIPLYIFQGLILIFLFTGGSALLYLNLFPIVGVMLIVQGLVFTLYLLDRQFDVGLFDANQLLRKIIMSGSALGIILGPAIGMAAMLFFPGLPLSFIDWLSLGIAIGCAVGIIGGISIGSMVNALNVFTERTFGLLTAGLWLGAIIGLVIGFFLPIANLYLILITLVGSGIIGALVGLTCDMLLKPIFNDHPPYNPIIYHNMLLGICLGSIIGFAAELILPVPGLNIILASSLCSAAGACLGMLSALIKGASQAKQYEWHRDQVKYAPKPTTECSKDVPTYNLGIWSTKPIAIVKKCSNRELLASLSVKF